MKRRNLQLDARIFGNKSVRPVVTAYWKLTLRIWRDEPLTDVIESSWELDNVEELQFEFQHYFDDTSSFEIRLIRFSEAGELDLIGPREDLRAVEKAYARQWQLNVLPAPFVSLRNLLQVDLTNGAHGPLLRGGISRQHGDAEDIDQRDDGDHRDRGERETCAVIEIA